MKYASVNSPIWSAKNLDEEVKNALAKPMYTLLIDQLIEELLEKNWKSHESLHQQVLQDRNTLNQLINFDECLRLLHAYVSFTSERTCRRVQRCTEAFIQLASHIKEKESSALQLRFYALMLANFSVQPISTSRPASFLLRACRNGFLEILRKTQELFPACLRKMLKHTPGLCSEIGKMEHCYELTTDEGTPEWTDLCLAFLINQGAQINQTYEIFRYLGETQNRALKAAYARNPDRIDLCSRFFLLFISSNFQSDLPGIMKLIASQGAQKDKSDQFYNAGEAIMRAAYYFKDKARNEQNQLLQQVNTFLSQLSFDCIGSHHDLLEGAMGHHAPDIEDEEDDEDMDLTIDEWDWQEHPLSLFLKNSLIDKCLPYCSTLSNTGLVAILCTAESINANKERTWNDAKMLQRLQKLIALGLHPNWELELYFPRRAGSDPDPPFHSWLEDKKLFHSAEFIQKCANRLRAVKSE